MQHSNIKRILIYRLGSIGDFVVALPCLHAIRRRYPNAEIALLTNFPIDSRTSPAQSVLEHIKLIDRYFSYSPFDSILAKGRAIRKIVSAFPPDLLIYLTEPRAGIRSYSSYRDYAFFLACGIRNFVGLPMMRSMRRINQLAECPPKWEAEASRLARCMFPHFGVIALDEARNWDLCITPVEQSEAKRALTAALNDQFGNLPLIGLSVGTKQKNNDWGVENWRSVLIGLKDLPHGLVLFGATVDRAASEQLAAVWPNPYANLCGLLSPRVSAAAMRSLDVMLCHDSGPMHLAAAIGVRCVAVFSRNNRPGWWYPNGPGHTVFYPPSSQDTIQATRPPEVIAAVKTILNSTTSRAKN